MDIAMGSLEAQNHLALERCPHCQVAKPLLSRFSQMETKDHSQRRSRTWSFYSCATCGGVVMTAVRDGHGLFITEMFPDHARVADGLPPKAAAYLSQAIACIHAPAGAVMLAASSVDAMLKDKGYIDGSLYSRIEKAAADHLITAEMALWAHEVRLEANDQRHADAVATLPTEEDAKRTVDFANALAEFLFVLPARVARGRQVPPNLQ